MKAAPALAALLSGAVACNAGAGTESFADYFPLALGYSWKYVNSQDPGDFFYWDVLGPYPFGGYPGAVQLGSDPDNFWIVANDGAAFSFLGAVTEGVLADIRDVTLGDFSDGTVYDFDGQLTVIRRWENLDHRLTGAYGIDPTLTDVVVLVWYDDRFRPNSQNLILESGGGVSYDAGVTDIDFLRQGVGPTALIGVDAESGAASPRFDVVASFDCNGNQVADHGDISSRQSQDADKNGVPDECECPADLDATGAVGITDLLALLATWGDCAGCAADLDGDGAVGITDLLVMLAQWGPCP